MLPRAALIQLGLVVLLFGGAFPVMKLGLADATPAWFAFWRALLAACTTTAIVALRGGLRLPARADLPVVLAVGLCQIAGFFVLLHIGLTIMPAGPAALLCYTTGLWLVPISALVLREPVTRRRGGAVALGLAGILVLADPVDVPALGVLLLLGVSLLWSIAIAVLRISRPVSSLVDLLPWQFGIAVPPLLIAAQLLEPEGGVTLSTGPVLALAYLGVFGGPVATWAANSVARALPALVTSIGFLGVPVLGLGLSVAILAEPVTPRLLAGAALILSALLTLNLRRPV